MKQLASSVCKLPNCAVGQAACAAT